MIGAIEQKSSKSSRFMGKIFARQGVGNPTKLQGLLPEIRGAQHCRVCRDVPSQVKGRVDI